MEHPEYECAIEVYTLVELSLPCSDENFQCNLALEFDWIFLCSVFYDDEEEYEERTNPFFSYLFILFVFFYQSISASLHFSISN